MRHRDLESWQGYFAPHGPNCETVETSLLGLRCIFTMDPENIKAILATQFKDYGKGSRFHNDWAPFLGDSIFTTDGKQWRASRQLLRPQFVKQRVSDLSIFERHVQILLGYIINIGNGERVDIKDLFLRYTLDTATEFLFGESIGSLHNPLDEFSRAFAEVQRVQNIITKSG
jgi:cytochrome P450